MKKPNFSKHLLGWMLLASPMLLQTAAAQNSPLSDQCGTDLLYGALRSRNPAFDAQLSGQLEQLRNASGSYLQNEAAGKASAGPYKIQVVFHIVLDSNRVAQLGGAAGIAARVTSQMQQLNDDWNARNADSVKIPAPFKPLYANMAVQFVLATKTPSGAPTPGYEIVYTNKASFDVQTGTTGSTYGFSDVKYASSGGAAAWDPGKYYNVWVTNMTPLGILGMATPPPHPPFDAFPAAEQGTVILYGAFGRRTSPSQFFSFPQAQAGRTLTHETGHFLNLFHTWGSDNSCNDDDGVGDTPLQATSTPNNAPAFPVFDGCTGSGSGIMFMNFMDYAIDTAQYLFTKGQSAATRTELDPGGLRHSLVAAALELPFSGAAVRELRLRPNPAGQRFQILISIPDAEKAVVYDLTGRQLLSLQVSGQQTPEVDCSQLTAGSYYVGLYSRSGQLLGATRLAKR